MNALIFIIILVMLILVHEFGHFIVAKAAKIRVDEFG
ncbi:MAG: site-2 protease family protein, partial [Patescibacteria group bacterium]|nr:site-2 protease family protein [Patescibacteria group bacterium]